MSLIKSISGMRGTIGGKPGESLSPIDIVEFSAAYAMWLKRMTPAPKIIIGRDGRVTGSHVQTLVMQTITAAGIDVIDLGLSTTPTVEMYVIKASAQGGIIVTASHNPMNWNALKFLNHRGEFISADDGAQILEIARSRTFEFATPEQFGKYSNADAAIEHHVDKICSLELVDVERVRSRKYHLVVDCVNSTGALAIPPLLDRLGCTYDLLNAEITGQFAHDPEPLPANLTDLMDNTARSDADLGIAVDPDVDRLAFVSEDGSYFGEEYTLVAVADYILGKTPGNTVSNMSSTLALRDVTLSHQQAYYSSPVGEVNVVEEMKRRNAVVGGEGNGGIIYPELHYGRDALVGIALMLAFMASSGKTASEIRSEYPDYQMVKTKIGRDDRLNFGEIKDRIAEALPDAHIDARDGIKATLEGEWIQLRKSNTEPIIRIYAESKTLADAELLVAKVKGLIQV